MIAVVPAAGRGTRLGALTATIPKALVSVGGRPALAWVLEGIAAAGIAEVVVVTGHLGEQIERRVSELSPIPVRTVRQPVPRGTADALLAARDVVGDVPFLYAWGDVIAPPDAVAAVLRSWDAAVGRASSSPPGPGGAIAVNRVDDPASGAAVAVDDGGQVTSIVEKPMKGTSTTPFNHAGIGVLAAEVWPLLARVGPSVRGELELTDALSALIDTGLPVTAVEVGPVFDIGTPEQLADADRWLRAPRPLP